MASSSRKKSKSKTNAKANIPAESEVVDAVVIEETDGAQSDDGQTDDALPDDARSDDASMETVDEMADADGVKRDDVGADGDDVRDVVDEAASEETIEPVEDVPEVVAAPEPAPERSNSFLPLVLGGLIAGAIGFLAAQSMGPQGWTVAQSSALKGTVDTQATSIEALTAQLETASTQTATLDAQTQTQMVQIASLEAQLAQLTEQVNAAPVSTGDVELPADLAALLNAQKAEISALQEDLRSMAAFADGQIASAQQETEAAKIAEARAAARDDLNKVRLALASGASFEDALPGIAGAVDVPAALSDVAAGVATQSDLQSSFGGVSRRALAASNRALSGDSAGDRASLFFQDLIGARSLTPQEGDSPDAVLSRAEDAVQNGDIAGALTTLDALPEDGKAELTEWSGLAKARGDALQAFSDLTDALSAD